MIKTTIRDIRKSLGRYIAILGIIALGVGFFSGLKVSRDAMVFSANEYLDEKKFFDYHLVSTKGFSSENLQHAKEQLGKDFIVEGSKQVHFLYKTSKNIDKVLIAINLPTKLNKIQLEKGRMPKKRNEVLGDSRYFKNRDIGKKIQIAHENSDKTKSSFASQRLTIVGICKSPLFLNFDRGSSELGNGQVSAFIYTKPDLITNDYYSNIYIRFADRSEDSIIYSKKYDKMLDSSRTEIKSVLDDIINERRNELLSRLQSELESKREEINAGKATLEAEKSKAMYAIYEKKAEVNEQKQQINEAKSQLLTAREQLSKQSSEYFAKLSEYENLMQLYNNSSNIPESEKLLMKKRLEEASVFLAEAKSKLDRATLELESQEKILSDNKVELDSGIKELNAKEYELEATFATKNQELDKALEQLAQTEQLEIKKLKVHGYCLDAYSNLGFALFKNDSNIINGVAKVFPIFFFLTAALVCMTTMSRMVEESRVEIGSLKALGYSNFIIASRYLIYAGSSGFIGTIIGYFLGNYLFPKTIWNAYGIIYSFSDRLQYRLDPKIGILAFLVAMLCTTATTWISCYEDFRENPAFLLRPKPPKSGKRTLVEKIPPVWNHLSFLQKVSIRNTFRYKQRFLMMLLGISGCTALVLTGFGVNDSIKNISERQFSQLYNFDYTVSFKQSMGFDDASLLKYNEFLKSADSHIDDALLIHKSKGSIIKNKKSTETYIIATDGEKVPNFIHLENYGEEKRLPDDGGILICEKLAKENKIQKGDTVSLKNSKGQIAKLRVDDIFINHVLNYTYMTPATYEKAWGSPPKASNALIKVRHVQRPIDLHDKTSENKILDSSASVMEMNQVASIDINMDTYRRIDAMMNNLNSVILLIIISAGILAFIVLYNLTNINITERAREIATLKVLGFNEYETISYVFREIIMLTIMSSLLGLGLGRALHAFVMLKIQVEMVYYDVHIMWYSYIYSILITIGFALLVSFIMYFKVRRISMADSLKAVE